MCKIQPPPAPLPSSSPLLFGIDQAQGKQCHLTQRWGASPTARGCSAPLACGRATAWLLSASFLCYARCWGRDNWLFLSGVMCLADCTGWQCEHKHMVDKRINSFRWDSALPSSCQTRMGLVLGCKVPRDTSSLAHAGIPASMEQGKALLWHSQKPK